MEKSGTISDSKKYITMEQLCEQLQVSKQHIYRLIHRREIPFIPLGRVRRFDPIAIDEWMRKRSIAPARA